MTIKLHGDELGRYWVQAQFDETPRKEEGALLTLVSLIDGQVEVIGNAFIILDQGAAAICLTAAHCLEEVKRKQNPERGRHHVTLPEDFRAEITNFIEPSAITAIYLFEGEPVICKVRFLMYIDQYDVAVLVVEAPDGRRIFTGRLGVDLAAPKVGDEIAILGHALTLERHGEGHGVITRSVQMNLGVVTDVTMGFGRMRQSYYFDTTIPIRGGFSGAPIVRKPELEKPIVVCGVASFDISSDEAFSSFLVPGNSACSMLWPAMGLFLPAIMPNNNVAEHTLLANFLQPGLFDDHTKGVTVEAIGNEDRIEIRYLDTRVDPPQGHLLTTRGIPPLVNK